jgi:hypothetical protein
MTSKHIYAVQVGDKITTCGDTPFTDIFHVVRIDKMPNGKPFMIKGDGGKAIITGNNDDRTVSVL